ncbi:MAG: pitrilysin family protein, partial [Thermodesulfobacteriota bacterium]|nr:pitrilysin family protein [Thermodesulfobacteriota bacterium]
METIKRFVLDNGLIVVLQENHYAKLTSIRAWVKTGSLHEKENVAGISHFIEHMLFKGTKNKGIGEIAQIVESSGGCLNASTSFDNTVFYMTILSKYVNEAIEVISDLLSNPIFDTDDIEMEKEVILEEIHMGDDMPRRKLYDLVF